MTQSFFSFEALNPQENIHRWYNLMIGTNLFGEGYILTSWGRKGHKGGQMKEYVFIAFNEARKKTISICRKRLKATSRIGCNYICTNHGLTLENIDETLKIISHKGTHN